MERGTNASTTCFVRGLPPSTTHHLLSSLFSSQAPVKKASVVPQTPLAYGFVRFMSSDDAKSIEREMNGVVIEHEGRRYKLSVEVADRAKAISAKKGKDESATEGEAAEGDPDIERQPVDEELAKLKRTARVIIRNLSFYAKESHIRNVMSKFGTIKELTLPLVPADARDKGKKSSKKQHRGFAFVTFSSQGEAQRAVDICAKDGVEIRQRSVAVDFSVSKGVHQASKAVQNNLEENSEDEASDDSSSDDDDEEEEEEDGDEEEEEEKEKDSDAESDNMEEEEDDDEEEVGEGDESSGLKRSTDLDDVSARCTAFVRNLPYDTERKTLFDLFKQYGAIASIFIVTDKVTGLGKGTAFVKFKYEAACSRALEAGRASEDSPFVSTKDNSALSSSGGGGITLSGRRLLVDLAVDQRTAESLKVERDASGKAIKTGVGKDKRNLYLKMEGYITNDDGGFNNLPRLDQEKRQRAASEKNTKLRSPLFFINPVRLSIRNLAKAVDEAGLKRLVVEGIKKGLTANLVSETDVSNKLKAEGLPARETIGDAARVPEFNDKNVKMFVPSLYIDREVNETTEGKKVVGNSRGYGFVEFTHHAHALACLRELNNNPKYSKEWVMHGTKVAELLKRGKGEKSSGNVADFLGEDGKIKTPRLVVEFTVENKAKANKQRERLEKQRANAAKQKEEGKSEKVKKKDGGEGKVAKSRGALQREKKRKAREEGQIDGKAEKKKKREDVAVAPVKPSDLDAHGKAKKSKQKMHIDDRKELAEEKSFDALVEKYKKTLGGSDVKETVPDVTPEDVAAARGDGKAAKRKRWFE